MPDQDIVSNCRVHRSFRGLMNGAELRTAEFDGASHIVVPVVALVGNTIVRPMNSDGPEFVPVEELASAPAGWNGRPCVPGHPNDGRSSANEPEILEQYRFGHVFHTKFESGKLKMEAYLDPARAEKVGRDATRVIERCRAGETVEVSVGAYITAEPRSGTFNNESYVAVWRDIVPDHLALLPEGSTGACSVEMGCGAPRLNQASQSTTPISIKQAQLRAAVETEPQTKDQGGLVMPNTENGSPEHKPQGLISRLFSSLRLRSAAEDDGISDRDLRNKLWDALRAVEPGFDWVEEVYQDTSTVIYTVFPEREILWFRRTFAIAEDGSVSLNDDREQVEPVMRYEVVTAAAAAVDEKSEPPVVAESDCKCKTTGHAAQGGSAMDAKKKSELVGRLIASKAVPFDEKDRKYLEGWEDKKLTELSALADGANTEPSAPTPTPTPPTEGNGTEKADDKPAPPSPSTPSPMTEEQWMAAAPETLRGMVSAYKAQEAERRTALISTLSGAVNGAYTEDQLKAKSTDDLTSLARALKADQPTPTYIGRGLPRAAAAESTYEPPDPYDLKGLEEARRGRSNSAAASVAN